MRMDRSYRHRNGRNRRPEPRPAPKPKNPGTIPPKVPTTARQKKLMLKDSYKRLSRLLRIHGAQLREMSLLALRSRANSYTLGKDRGPSRALVNKIDRLLKVLV